MMLSSGLTGQEAAIPEFYRDVFAASEGEAEGDALFALTQALMDTTPPEALFCVTAGEVGDLKGCIFFSRLFYEDDPRDVVMMSPVAVRTDYQGQGIGRKLIAYGLDQMRQAGLDVVVTYGDPAYYSKAGFQPMTIEFASPPHALSMPHGWQGQSLTKSDLTPLAGSSRCVSAFDVPEMW
ncbi:GNAT family N-acetyltransferase [Ruegeria lacuscaerulensis]|uniref:GNAT family N-acetyltransferase n=1 Tax=Ruegeria lacuscaerulensis TaxID=55218 RepID=UPI00147BBAF9|nr:N-acetyltransferase [Ruegeria lacuscaerulensis]